MAAHPELQKQVDAIEAHNRRYEYEQQVGTNAAKEEAPGTAAPLVTIPVVVHVVYNSPDQNISDAEIQAQLDVLNADFRKLNADFPQMPTVFSALAADARVAFCLAKRDPNGNPTTGIVRRATSVFVWSVNDDMKYDNRGGSNAWNTSQYLNIWCCNLGMGNFGYAYKPGYAPTANVDGVVITTDAFGPNGVAPHNFGRTATHEVGHWLNLEHIWGTALPGYGTCSDTDGVSDTPNQLTATFGCPASPKISCSNGPNGDMFMNYMDYTDDACMYMFSQGQATRMQAVVVAGGFRGALRSSPGLAPTLSIVSSAPATIACGDQTDYGFRVNPLSVGCGGGSVRYQWAATNGWTVTAPNQLYPKITPNGTSGSTITLTGTYTNAQGFAIPLNSVSVTIGFVGQVPPTPVFTGGAGPLCEGQSFMFTVSPVAGASGYQWTVPAGFSPSGIVTTTAPALTVTPGFGILGGSYTIQVQSLAPMGCPFSSKASRSFQVIGVGSSQIVDTDPNQRYDGVVCMNNRIGLTLVPPNPSGGAISNIVWSVSGGSIYSGQGTTQIVYRTVPVGGATSIVQVDFMDGCGIARTITNNITTQQTTASTFPYLGNGYDCRTNPARPYPNPATSTLQLPAYQGQVLLYDHLGKPVKSVLAPGTDFGATLDVSGLPAGLYLVVGRHLDGQLTRHSIQIQH